MSPTVSELLERLRELGATVQARGDRLRITAPQDLPPELVATLRGRKPELLAALRHGPREPHRNPADELRGAYRRWFTLTVAEADGTKVVPAEVQALYQEIVRLTDDAGPAWADAVHADELRRFRWETARCGACGGLGHDTPHESEDLSA